MLFTDWVAGSTSGKSPTAEISRFTGIAPLEADMEEALAAPVMSRFTVDKTSVGTALGQGIWVKLTTKLLPPALLCPWPYVQWPIGTATATIWSRAQKDGGPTHETTINDPAIQDYEVIGSWDAVHHVPTRLQLDFWRRQP